MLLVSVRVSNFIKLTQLNLKGEIGYNSVIVKDINITLYQWTDHAEKKINKETSVKLHYRSGGLNRFRTFHLNSCRVHILFSTGSFL
jgi:hypothetical protein